MVLRLARLWCSCGTTVSILIAHSRWSTLGRPNSDFGSFRTPSSKRFDRWLTIIPQVGIDSKQLAAGIAQLMTGKLVHWCGAQHPLRKRKGWKVENLNGLIPFWLTKYVQSFRRLFWAESCCYLILEPHFSHLDSELGWPFMAQSTATYPALSVLQVYFIGTPPVSTADLCRPYKGVKEVRALDNGETICWESESPKSSLNGTCLAGKRRAKKV